MMDSNWNWHGAVIWDLSLDVGLPNWIGEQLNYGLLF